MKKLLWILGGLVALVLVAAIVLPILFKDDIFAIVKEEANNNLNAKVDFGDFGLTLFKSFPDFTLTIEDVKVSGVDEFEGIDLAAIKKLEVTVDIMSVINGDKIEVVSFGLVEPNLNVIVLKDGKANYDIAKASDEPEAAEPEPESDEPAKFNVSVQEYYIESANVVYDDRQGGTFAELKNFTHRGNGDFTQDIFLLKTITTADAVTAVSGGVKYLNRVKLDLKFDLDMDLPNSKYTFNENSLQLNQLFLGFDGWVAMPGDDIDMDLTFMTRETTFKSILSLIPAVYATDFESIETDGKLALNGFAKGTMRDDALPAFDLKLNVADARFQYPDLPKSVEGIQVDLHVQNPGGSEDLTVIDLNKFHMEMAGNPVDMQLHMRTPISDPYMDVAVQTQIDLESIKDVVPMEEGQDYSGIITADVTMKGNQSAIDNEQYDKFQAGGQMSIVGMKYTDPELPYAMSIDACYLNFSPQHVELSKLNMLIGKSDIAATGRIDNLLAYYMADDPLTGRFDMTSNLIDLNEFMEEEEGESAAEGEGTGEEEELSVIEVPGNLDFTMNASILKILYDNMEMTNVAGGIVIRDQKVDLRQLAMDMLDGRMIVTGGYDTKIKGHPVVDFNLDISRFDVEKTYQTFNTVQEMAPIAERAKGKFSCKTSFVTSLDSKMEPVMNTLNGQGRLQTHTMVIDNDKGVLGKVAKVLKYDALKKMDMNDVNISFEFKEGKVIVEPFDFDLGSGKGTMSGWSAFDNTIDYVMNLDVPTSEFGGAANQALTGLISQANKSGLGLNAPERVNIDVLITGATDDPKITPKWAGTGEGSNPVDQVKEKVKEELDKKKEEVKEKVNEGVDKAKAEAEKKKAEARKKIMENAKKQADQTRAQSKAAAEKVRKEGYAQAKKTEDKAKNPIQKKVAKETAKKMRKEADNKADKVIKEGNANADKIMAEAKKKADAVK